MKLFKNLFTIFFTVIIYSSSFAQISPGDLSSVHSQLEGVSKCTKCHDLGNKVTNKKCLNCHLELKVRTTNNKGYHSSKEVKGKQCATCHSDHHGANFKIIKLEGNKFNHNLTGFTLRDAHRGKKCVDCHKPKNISNQKIKLKKFTFLGLMASCKTCHKDIHQKTLSVKCNNCHNEKKFKPATKFNHDKAKYQLRGKHIKVDCIKCHKKGVRNGEKFQEFTGLKFTKCVDCHKDVHNNQFGQNCEKCHVVASFHKIKSTGNFNHDKTKYKLEGKHLDVDCKKCHKVSYTKPIKFAKCVDCHTDYHEKQFKKDGVSPDCATCHSTSGFSKFSYTIERHNKSIFPLKGAHLATPCFDCHKKNTEKWSFRQVGIRCVDCHNDIHKNSIDKKYYPNQTCKNCHNSSKWSTVKFDHSITKFKLLGQHKKQACKACHFKKDETNKVQQKFLNLPVVCSACHTDIHFKQFEKDGKTACEQCHNAEAFKPAFKFNHNNTKFKLTGKHQNVQCYKCHKQTKENNNTYIKYKIKTTCESCHS